MDESSAFASDLQEKRRHRRRFFATIVMITVAYGIFLSAVWFFVRSPVFRVEHFTISGNEKLGEKDITDFLRARLIQGNSRWLKALLGFNNMLIWPRQVVGADLIFLPRLKNIAIEKNWSRRSISAIVEERKPIGIWCSEQARNSAESTRNDAENSPRSSASCYWFDKDGVMFERAPDVAGSLISAAHDYSQKNSVLLAKILPDEFIQNALSAFAVLRASALNIKEIRLNDISLEELEARTYNGPTLYFSLRFPADNALAAIQSLAAKPGFSKLQYLDFRVENRVYYK